MFPEATSFLSRLKASLDLDLESRAEVLREIEDHIEDRLESLIAKGASPEEARRALLRGLGRPTTFARLLRQASTLPSWGDAIFAALPALLLAGLLGAHLWQVVWLAVPSCLLFVGVTLAGLRMGPATWFHYWAGVALSLMLLFGYLALRVLQREFEVLTDGNASPFTFVAALGAGLYISVGLGVFLSAIVMAARRDWLDGSVLLSPMPGVLVWLVAVHQVRGLDNPSAAEVGTFNVLAGVFLAMAPAVVCFQRAGTRRARIVILFSTALGLLTAGTLIDSGASPLLLLFRLGLLLAFLLSPALVSRGIEAREASSLAHSWGAPGGPSPSGHA
jgi:hypothetical protein